MFGASLLAAIQVFNWLVGKVNEAHGAGGGGGDGGGATVAFVGILDIFGEHTANQRRRPWKQNDPRGITSKHT